LALYAEIHVPGLLHAVVSVGLLRGAFVASFFGAFGSAGALLPNLASFFGQLLGSSPVLALVLLLIALVTRAFTFVRH
jgi:hypothetical protein